MEFEFTCDCGHEISEMTRGERTKMSVQVPCRECGAVYAVTVTRIQNSE